MIKGTALKGKNIDLRGERTRARGREGEKGMEGGPGKEGKGKEPS